MPLLAVHEQNTVEGNPQIYNGFDICTTHKILDKLLQLPLYGPTYNLERGMQGPAMEMMFRGFLVDPNERERAINDLRFRLNGIHNVLNILSEAISGGPLSYSSGPQIKHLFYDILQIPPVKKHKDGETKLPMDEETLDKLRLKHPMIRPLCSGILSCRKLKKLLEKVEMEVDDDWRIRSSVNVAGTNEHRMSYSQSFDGTGGNLQTIPESVRKMFISDPGYRLLGIDKEQAEARWVGFYCGIIFNDWSYLDLLESGDGHTAVARMVWPDLPWTGDLKKDRQIAEKPFAKETYRQSCKILSHATNIYGRPPTISVHTGIPESFVRKFQEDYFKALPCIPKYFQWISQQLQTKGFLTNAFGCSRDFFDRPHADETLRKALAYMQAGSNANDINLGGWRMWKYMKSRIQLLTQEHDAWYSQYKETDNEEEIIEECQNHLKVEFDLGNRKFSVPTDVKVGLNKGLRWKLQSDGRKVEINPHGLDKPRASRPESYYVKR